MFYYCSALLLELLSWRNRILRRGTSVVVVVEDDVAVVFIPPELVTRAPSLEILEESILRTCCCYYYCFELLSWCSFVDGVVVEVVELSLFLFDVGDLGCFGFVFGGSIAACCCC